MKRGFLRWNSLGTAPVVGAGFHVKLESKALVGGHRAEFSGAPTRSGVPIAGSVFIDIDEFQYNYKCSICGHEWYEKRVEDEPE